MTAKSLDGAGKAAVRAAGELAASHYLGDQVMGFDRVATHLADGMTCVVEVERFTAKVDGGSTSAAISLRVTSVHRVEDGTWKLVPRHADPITAPRDAAALVGG